MNGPNVRRYAHSFRHSTGIGRTDGPTDRNAISIACSACIACLRATKIDWVNNITRDYASDSSGDIFSKLVTKFFYFYYYYFFLLGSY